MMPELCLNQLHCITQLLYTVLQKKEEAMAHSDDTHPFRLSTI